MPTMSSSFCQPLVTPRTALAISERVSPCIAAWLSFSRLTCSAPSLVSSVMPGAISAETLPLGPSTTTVLPSTLYLTPAGSGISFFPIRDIESILHLACESRRSAFAPRSTAARTTVNSDQWTVISFWLPESTGLSTHQLTTVHCPLHLPHFAQQLAAHAFAARLTAGHHALGRGEDANAQTALDALDLVAADVHAAAGTRDARQIADSR